MDCELPTQHATGRNTTWKLGWHGTHMNALPSILTGGLRASSSAVAGARLFPGMEGVYTHIGINGPWAQWYSTWTPLARTGLAHRVWLELWVDTAAARVEAPTESIPTGAASLGHGTPDEVTVARVQEMLDGIADGETQGQLVLPHLPATSFEAMQRGGSGTDKPQMHKIRPLRTLIWQQTAAWLTLTSVLLALRPNSNTPFAPWAQGPATLRRSS
jgi:hypothetical protein